MAVGKLLHRLFHFPPVGVIPPLVHKKKSVFVGRQEIYLNFFVTKM